MASLASIRSKLKAKIFDKFGSTATREALSAQTTDKWGDETPTYGSGTTITVVPYNYIPSRNNYQPFGDLQENQLAIVVEYDTTVAESDRITYDSTQYKVIEIEDYVYDDAVIARNLLLAKIL